MCLIQAKNVFHKCQPFVNFLLHSYTCDLVTKHCSSLVHVYGRRKIQTQSLYFETRSLTLYTRLIISCNLTLKSTRSCCRNANYSVSIIICCDALCLMSQLTFPCCCCNSNSSRMIKSYKLASNDMPKMFFFLLSFGPTNSTTVYVGAVDIWIYENTRVLALEVIPNWRLFRTFSRDNHLN